MSILVLSILLSLILSIAGTMLINAALHLVLLPALLIGALLFLGFWNCPRFFCH
jgi:hypothetical protein